jgi:hypothetical protein
MKNEFDQFYNAGVTTSKLEMSKDFAYTDRNKRNHYTIKKGTIVEGVAEKIDNVFALTWTSPEGIVVRIPFTYTRTIQETNENLSAEDLAKMVAEKERIRLLTIEKNKNTGKTGKPKIESTTTTRGNNTTATATQKTTDNSKLMKYGLIGLVAIALIIGGVIIYKKTIKK